MILLDVTVSDTPNWMTIAISVIGSSVFSYLITLATTNWVKKKEFEWSYKTYILEQRKEAYRKINDALSDVFKMVTNSQGQRAPAIFFNKKEDFIKQCNQLVATQSYRIWLSPQFEFLIMKFSAYLTNCYRHKSVLSEADYYVYVFNEFASMSKRREEIFKQFGIDLKNLSDVSDFIETRFKVTP